MTKVLALAAFLPLASLAAFAENWTGTGYISDEQCAVSGSKAKKAADWVNPDKFESCAQKCAKAGSPLVFVTEDNKILKIDAASMEKVMPAIGHKVKITGKVDGGKVTVDSVATLPM